MTAPRLITPRPSPRGPSNEDVRPSPTHVDADVLEYDFADVEIGTAEYLEGPTGCTVVHVPLLGARTFVDVRGGAPGYIGYAFNHAVCLCGGSVYGLEAASGVVAELRTRGGNSAAWDELPLVSGAVIYDLYQRDNTIYPDRELGREALRAARAGACAVGRVGAGISATVGKIARDRAEFTGQGAAFRQIGDVSVLVSRSSTQSA